MTVKTLRLVDTIAVATAFGVTSQCIYNWRNDEKNPIPTYLIPGNINDAVRFDPSAVKEWAKSTGKEIKFPRALEAKEQPQS